MPISARPMREFTAPVARRDPHAPRPAAELRDLLLTRARNHRNPFTFTVYGEVEEALRGASVADADGLPRAFAELLERHRVAAEHALAASDTVTARREYVIAYDYGHVGRFPAPTTAATQRLYRRSQQMFAAALAVDGGGIDPVTIPLAPAADGPASLPALLCASPAARRPLPVVIAWGGIDSFKEERALQSRPLVDAGMAVLCIDMPGVGDASGVTTSGADRMWNGIFEWIERDGRLDARRVACVGGSTGGYWATIVAHSYPDRIRGAVNHGGPAHFAFRADWIRYAQHAEYPCRLAETLGAAFGVASLDDWVATAPRLSLLTRGILDRPAAPMLLLNGTRDSVFPIEDMYLLLQHGDAKDARFVPDAGHMGAMSWSGPLTVGWLAARLRDAA